MTNQRIEQLVLQSKIRVDRGLVDSDLKELIEESRAERAREWTDGRFGVFCDITSEPVRVTEKGDPIFGGPTSRLLGFLPQNYTGIRAVFFSQFDHQDAVNHLLNEIFAQLKVGVPNQQFSNHVSASHVRREVRYVYERVSIPSSENYRWAWFLGRVIAELTPFDLARFGAVFP